MGLLSLGTPLSWDEAEKYADHVRKNGIEQFLNIWNRVKTRKRDRLLWGDEVEYIVVKVDDKNKQAKLSLNAFDVLTKLQALEKEALDNGNILDSSWKPEYGRYMLESTPSLPYGGKISDLLTVEENMVKRRKLATSLMGDNEHLLSMTIFPLLGCPGFLEPWTDPRTDQGASLSLFIPDTAINPHARFATLTANIRKRRASKVAINVPIFQDKYTPKPFFNKIDLIDKLSKGQYEDLLGWSDSFGKKEGNPLPDALPDHIYMDCMCFGMGCSCLQITFQACSIEEARKLYDHLAVLAPIMLALSAAAPVFRGYLSDVDCRWDIISASVDDRNKQERGIEPLSSSKFRIKKSRYDSISSYLSPGPIYSGGCCGVQGKDATDADGKLRGDYYKDKYNDLDIAFDQSIYKQLLEAGVDDLLAKHYAHLFIRDPLVIYKELIDQDNQQSSDHFENIQSTNWQTMRFKPPPPNVDMGWRVEFRSMEVQKTDFENAAFSVFIVLMTRAILSFNVNLYIPLSKVDENMKRAQKRDAVLNQKFWFRNEIKGTNDPSDSYSEMSMDVIMNGNDDFVGLVPLVRQYIEETNPDIDSFERLDSYLNELSSRASGAKPTNAKSIRSIVRSHPAYAQDSVVGQEINYDIIKWYLD